MSTTILLLSDTHYLEWKEVHKEIKDLMHTVDITIHCGDYTRLAVIKGLQNHSRRFVGVHGNSDPIEIREMLPYIKIILVEDLRLGIIHPAWGGPPFDPTELVDDFPGTLDVIFFGHSHELLDQKYNGIRYVNPGQGYSSFGVQGTVALITCQRGDLSVQFLRLNEDANNE